MKHRSRMRRYGTTDLPVKKISSDICNTDKCKNIRDKKSGSKFCGHCRYINKSHKNNPGVKRRYQSNIQRLKDNVVIDKKSDCWNWQLFKNKDGYGKVIIDGKSIGAHRLSYTINIGPIPKGINVCHHCDNPGCCNPSHLFLGTQKENMLDMYKKGRQKNQGKPRILSALQLSRAKNRISKGERMEDLAKELNVNQTTLRRNLKRGL